MSFETFALISPTTGVRRLALRAAAVAAAITLAFFPAAAQAQAQTTLTVTTLADSGNGSLRAVIAQSASTPSGQSTIIDFASGLTGTIPLASTLSICNGQTMTIQGASQIAVSGQNNVPVFNTCSGTNVTLSGLTIENGLISNQPGPPGGTGGGGIQNNGILTVTNSKFSGNSATAPSDGGGAIENNDILTVSNSTFSGNSATVDAGSGILNVGAATVINNTFSGNTGTALVNFDVLTVTNSTISGNNGGGVADDSPNGLGTQLKSTILAGNTGGNLIGVFVSQGYNLSDDGSGVFASGVGNTTGDMSSTPAGLDPKGLQNNGGPTQTIALLPASPAVDAIPVASCTDISGNPVTTDQRGVGRPQGKGCDIGAYELIQSVPFASFSAELAIFTQKPYGYVLAAVFTPGANGTPITPASQAVTLQIASYTVTFPAGSFKQVGKGTGATYAFEGTINGVTTGMVITPLGGNRYGLAAAGSPVNLTAATNPVAVTLTVGNNSGTAAVKASRLP